jgi:hypothetical protein
MQRKTMLDLSDQTHMIRAIKFIDLNAGKMGVTMKGVGLKMHRMRGISSIRLVQGGGTQSVVQQLVDSRLEGVKLVHEFGFHGVKFVLDLGLELRKMGIGRANIKLPNLDGVMGFIVGSLQVLVASGGHWERGSAGKGKWVGGTRKKDL